MVDKAKGHRLVMEDREKMSLTGVRRVHSFDPKEIVLETELGMLSIKGDKLGIKQLNLQESMVEIEGHVDVLAYPRSSGNREGLLGRIFK